MIFLRYIADIADISQLWALFLSNSVTQVGSSSVHAIMWKQIAMWKQSGNINFLLCHFYFPNNKINW